MTRRGWIFALVAALLAVSFALPASAQTDPSEVSGNEMADGPWTGSFTAFGTQTRSEGGVNATVYIEDSGTFSFTVAGGATSGTWSSAGTNTWQTDPGQSVTLTGTSNLTSSGGLSGDRTNLTGTGTTRQSGTLIIEADGRTSTRPISSNTSLTFSMTVTGASCEAATGTMAGSFIRGTFTAINGASFDGELAKSEAIALVPGLAEHAIQFNAFILQVGWSVDGPAEGATDPTQFPMADFMELMTATESVLNQLRNLSACTALQVGQDRAETWANMLTQGIASMIEAAADGFNLSVAQVRTLASAGLRMGAIGPGAVDRAGAARVEESLRVRTEKIFNRGGIGFMEDCENRGGRGCISFHHHVLSALLLGAQMDWSFEVEFWDTTTATFTAIDLLSRPDKSDL